MDVVLLKIVLLAVMFVTTVIFGLAPLKLLMVLRKRAFQSRASKWPSLFLCLLSCFSGGVFLATCFLHLLPEVNENWHVLVKQMKIETEYPIPELVSVLGFFLVYFVEEFVIYSFRVHVNRSKKCHSVMHIHVIRSPNDQHLVCNDHNSQTNIDHSCSLTDSRTNESGRGLTESLCKKACNGIDVPVSAEPECCEGPCEGRDEDPPIMMGFKPHEHSHGVRSITLLIALSFHSIIEGLALGVQSNSEAVIALFVSIIIHKCVVAFGVGVQLARTHAHKLGLVILSILLWAIMSPVGCATGIGVEQARMYSNTKDAVIMVLDGLSVGTFLYVTFFEVLLHERDNEHPNMGKLIATFFGFVVIALMRIIEHEHLDELPPSPDAMNSTATSPFVASTLNNSWLLLKGPQADF